MTFFKRIVNDIDSVFARDPAARSRLEVILCYPGFHAILFYRLSSWLWRHQIKLPARFISMLARFFTGIDIHPGAKIGERFFIDHGMGVVIGETASIGDDVTIYHDVTLGGVSPGSSVKGSLRHPQVGNRVIIGAGAQLLGPITVGNNARVGSNAVVVVDVAPNSTVVGVPAHAVSEKSSHAAKAALAFEPYGTPHDASADPMLTTMNQLKEQLDVLQRRVTELESDEVSLLSAKKWEGQ
jgi:serine O-acetyltransferase